MERARDLISIFTVWKSVQSILVHEIYDDRQLEEVPPQIQYRRPETQSIEISLTESVPPEEPNKISVINTLGDKNSFLDLRNQIDHSPFKPKEKSLNRVIVINDDVDHKYGKPDKVTEVRLSFTAFLLQ